jgi:hypothetical protein
MTDDSAALIDQELRVHGIDFDNNRRLALEIIAKFFVAPPLPEDQVKKAAEIIANSPLIDAPKLPAECWHGLARSILEVRALPLPEKIAGLVKRANDGAINTDDAEDRKLFANLGDALRALVKEINSLTVENGSLDEELSRKVKRIRELEAEREKLKQIANRQGALLFFEEGLKREANLIVERDQFAEQAAARDDRDRDMQEIMRINNELLAERRAWNECAAAKAIRAKTIEGCAKVADNKAEGHAKSQGCVVAGSYSPEALSAVHVNVMAAANDIAADIRALAQPVPALTSSD